MSRSVSLQDTSFQVVNKTYNDWDFWRAFSEGTWEPKTLAEIDKIEPGSLLFDIGAWIGPISMWAARRGVRCIAVEPDPIAYEDLLENIALNNLQEWITPVQAAVTLHNGTVMMGMDGGLSSSSMTRIGIGLDDTYVTARTLLSLTDEYGWPDIVKMVIEGGESMLLPIYGPLLRQHGIPMILSLHPHWYVLGLAGKLTAELANWKFTLLEKDTGFYEPI